MARTQGRTHIALLRGINVGGKNRVPMKQLAAMFEAAGCTEVTTYIQSGNVVFLAQAALVKRLPKLISASLSEELNVQVPVMMRTARELRAVLQNNPFLRRKGVKPEHLHVGFLAQKPTTTQVKALDKNRSPGDRFEVRDSEVYLCCPNGVARSKLTVAYFDKVLGTVMTARNWRTVQKLAEIAELAELRGADQG